MAKLVITLDPRLNQGTDVKRFILDSDKIVGLVEDIVGVKVAFVDLKGKVTQTYVAETFDDIADILVYSSYEPNYEDVE